MPRAKTPAEFTRDLPEGEGAGPGAPETAEPIQGRHTPRGAAGPAMRSMAYAPRPRRSASSSGHSRPDVRGAVATVVWTAAAGALSATWAAVRRSGPAWRA